MLKTGVALILKDMTGSLSGSDFVEVHTRLHLRVRCTHRDPVAHGALQYGVYNVQLGAGHHELLVATFEYGAGGALGNITTISFGGSLRTQAIATFLVEVGGRHRKFTASDGHEYSWKWRPSNEENIEWSCDNAGGHSVAWYAVPPDGRFFGVEEPYEHLAVDFLTTLMIMRHIAARNL